MDRQPDVLPPEVWIEPFLGDRADLRLALVAAMQTLPPAQRAVLLLRDVLAFSTAEVRRLLDAYVIAFETADVDALTTMLRADATLELLPNRAWFAGIAGCSRVFATAVGHPDDWRMDRVIVNGQPAVAAYLHGQPFGIAVLDVRQDGIAGVTVFGDPMLVRRITASTSS